MLKPNQTIKKRWTRGYAKKFSLLGYDASYGELFDFKVTDLIDSSPDKVIMICDNCGNEYMSAYRTYVRHQKKEEHDYCKDCLKLFRSQALYPKVLAKCEEMGIELVSPMSVMINQNVSIEYKCPIHGIRHSRIHHILAGQGCHICASKDHFDNYRTRTFEKRMDNLYNKALSSATEKGFKLITPKEHFCRSKDYIEYECSKHGIKKMRASNMANGRGCPDCLKESNRKRFRYTEEEIISKVEKCGGRILNPVDYVNNHTKNLYITCPICHEPFLTSVVIYTQHGGQLCSNCQSKMSMGEQKIKQYLEGNNIKYVSQKWFSDCRDINPLLFDFYLEDYSVAIEFDGRQHYGDTYYFSYSYEKTNEHDRIKDDYCKAHNIKMIRIPYWKIDSIDDYLDIQLPHKDIV